MDVAKEFAIIFLFNVCYYLAYATLRVSRMTVILT